MNLLLVEDEAEVANIIQRGLAAEGWSVTVVTDGEAALGLLASQRFEAILLDFMLPGIDGLGVVQTLRDRGNETPVLVLSALDKEDDRIRSLQTLSAESFSKPFDFDVLVERINKLISSNKNA